MTRRSLLRRAFCAPVAAAAGLTVATSQRTGPEPTVLLCRAGGGNMAFPATAGLKFFLADLVAISAGVRYTAETVEVWRIGDTSGQAEVCTII